MKIIHCEQRTPEWFAQKSGFPSASNFDKIITTDGKQSKQRTKYMHRLAAERVTGVCEESYVNQAILTGIQREDEARSFYELTQGTTVSQIGLCFSNDGLYCASPDGMVGEDGLIEIKCPEASTHVNYLLEGGLPTDYFQQVQGQLLVTHRKWVDFVSYYPGMKPLVFRASRDEGFINKLKAELELFCRELKEVVRRVS